MPLRQPDERLSNMLARLEVERQEGGENVYLSRAEARAIYLLAFAARDQGEYASDDADRLQAIVTKMAPVGWVA